MACLHLQYILFILLFIPEMIHGADVNKVSIAVLVIYLVLHKRSQHKLINIFL